MLSLMRKHAKSWLIKFLIAIIALVFIFYFGYSFSSREAVRIAEVNGEVITDTEYRKAYLELQETFQARYRDLWSEELAQALNLEKMALRNLIDQRIMSSEAERLGITVTKEEVQKAIAEYPAFQVEGRFNIGRYRAMLSNQRLKPEEFETGISFQLLSRKLRQFLFSFMQVTKQETLERYRFENEKVKISFVHFNPENFKERVKIQKSGVKEHFERNREEYRVPEKIRLGYVAFDPKDFEKEVKVSQSELKAYYEYYYDQFTTPEQIKARHIFFALDKNASEKEQDEVRKRAELVMKQAREGVNFEKLAKKFSEGPSKSNGGDLGYFSKGTLDKAFEKAAFDMNKGEIRGPVRSSLGYHIIKVEDIKSKKSDDFDEVKEEIRKTLIKDASTDMAHERGLSFIDQMPYDVDLETYGRENGYEMKSTQPFAATDPIPGIGGAEKLKEAIFILNEGDTSGLIEQGGKFYIFQLIEKKASYIPDFEDVAEEAEKAYIAQEASEMAKKEAEQFLEKLLLGREWRKLAAAKGIEPVETDFFKRSDKLEELPDITDIREIAFSLGEEHRYPDSVFSDAGGAYVIRWEASKGIDENEFKKDEEEFRLRVMQAKQNQAFEKWLEGLREDADIEIIRDPGA